MSEGDYTDENIMKRWEKEKRDKEEKLEIAYLNKKLNFLEELEEESG